MKPNNGKPRTCGRPAPISSIVFKPVPQVFFHAATTSLDSRERPAKVDGKPSRPTQTVVSVRLRPSILPR